MIVEMAAANGVKDIYVGQDCLMSTPGVSALITKLNKENDEGYVPYCFGGFILSASHNPGGPNGDFGIKFNGSNGGSVPESVTEAIYQQSMECERYLTLEGQSKLDFGTLACTNVLDSNVHVIDPTQHYVELM